MEEEDWSKTANAPSFTLFKHYSPEEYVEIYKRNGHYIDPIIWQRWRKNERKRFQSLASPVEETKEQIVREYKKGKITPISIILATMVNIKESLKQGNYSAEK